MSIASDLVALRTKMITALNAISNALVAKGVNPALHYSDVPEQIAAIPTGGTPTLILKSEYVDATRTTDTEISFSGLDIASDETLAGVILNYQGTKSTSTSALNTIMILQNGDKWDFYVASSVNGAVVIGHMAESAGSFVKNGANGGTVTLATGWVLLEGTYRVTPFVMKVS